jgi:hypothetical protein
MRATQQRTDLELAPREFGYVRLDNDLMLRRGRALCRHLTRFRATCATRDHDGLT